MAKSLRRKLREISLEGAYSAEENARIILDERTSNLASREDVDLTALNAASNILVCRAGPERYGIALSDIAEIMSEQTCVPVPDGPPALVGLLGRRGHLVSVIDLCVALDIACSSVDARFKHFVLLRRNHPRIALRVEEAQGVRSATSITREGVDTFRADAVIGYAAVNANEVEDEFIVSMIDVESLIRPFLPAFPISGV